MHTAIHRDEFLTLTENIPRDSGVSITAGNGILLITSFTHRTSYRLPAYVLKEGQVFLNAEDWQGILQAMSREPGPMIDIKISALQESNETE
ncbi:hypothetical protein P22_1297 [Propionispora sp. 2/2-37]|uniref:hypothetical protein n=1 Tax=Propionispora sp. 2/2-37 TaxID=1677858 RepID=UPI0006BB5A4D|nr:hypothetical protein [Propionispora sp. 2/2-37]CUH95227.1 hypothetical protein P22_1297 [Propionispora sp. 2/2-37]